MTALERERVRLPVGAVVIGDDGIFVVGRGGELRPICAPMHARPSGWSAEPVATRRRPA